ncbi:MULTISPECIES: hypothetical protein [Pseudoalteromonas]|uniref:hypothetical protein n=1 Tax=Pseudoalteromonas TaxID=53246 RepID=UPI000C7CB49C|nr:MULTISPECIES: hypothetical protein [Pseudoalteromonas]AUJ69427.1 hypothetical protein PNC201_05570 [Pseudoalteromonas sp. NC201]MBR8842586.1 hypothetical protein [Pseudoalteromonas sp. JC3]MCF2827780.1 hypothetical protein [Pseudoalteromonas sp. OF5H-5]MCF2831469.1 hypothetical protein [Pseudoalteromonas sp. DL2-H6]MCF2925340.1 hypothetical protein [Pseudoalteromonas sp. DL2-H1]
MKLKFNKKSIKELSVNKILVTKMTPAVAGGNGAATMDDTCNSLQVCWTFRYGQGHCEVW